MNILAPMPRKSFLFASTSFEMMCQWPMVTPTSLNGAGCAAAGLAASAVANNKAENTVVFIRYLPVEPDFTLGLPSDVNAISPRECGKASRGGIFPRCRSAARVERKQNPRAALPAWQGGPFRCVQSGLRFFFSEPRSDAHAGGRERDRRWFPE